jgi:hypothetical protein
MRAVKGSLGHSPKRGIGSGKLLVKKGGARLMGAVESITGADPKGKGGVRQRPSAGLADPVPRTPSSMPLAPCLSPHAFAILRGMSIRKAGGTWEPMLLGIESRHCKVCKEELYRNKTFFSGGWSRCALCEDFVHYSCLANGKVSFLKARPRVCKTCRAAQGDTPSPSPKVATPVAVGS